MSPGGSGYFTCIQNMKLVTNKCKSGGLHEKHVVATWNLGNHLSICLSSQYLLNLLTYSMEQSPSEANRFSISPEIPRILYNSKVHYRIHKCPPPVPILSQLDSTSWRSILILSSHLHLGLPSGLFPSGFPTKKTCIRLLILIFRRLNSTWGRIYLKFQIVPRSKYTPIPL